jgi:hypothetical protein
MTSVKLEPLIFEREIQNLEAKLVKSNAENYENSLVVIRKEYEFLRSSSVNIHSETEKRVQKIYYEKQINKHKEEIKELVQKNETKCFNLKKRNYFLNEEIQSLKLERTKATNNLIQKGRCIHRLTKEVSELKAENEKLKETTKSKTLSSSSNEKSNESGTEIKIKEELKEQEPQAQVLSEEEKFKLRSIKIFEAVFDNLKKEYEDEQIKTSELNSKCLRQLDQIFNLNDLNQTLIEKVAILEKELDKRKQEITSLRTQDSILKQIEELNIRLIDKEAVNVLLQNEKANLLVKLEAQKQKIKSLESELFSMKSKWSDSAFKELSNNDRKRSESDSRSNKVRKIYYSNRYSY